MPCPIPFYAFIIICLPIQLAAYVSGFDEHFRKCAPFNCGHISDISYPFWLHGGADYCGHHGFEVACGPDGPDSNLILTMKSIRFKHKVKHIAWERQGLHIARMDLLHDLCPDRYTDTTLDPSLFEYVPGCRNATLYYDCKPSQIHDARKFLCEHMDRHRYGYLLPLAPEVCDQKLQLSKDCNHSISVPLLNRDVPPFSPPEIMHEKIVKALEAGFEVTWKVNMSECRSCNISGGRCGHDITTSEFNCFCPDGVHLKTCPKPGGKVTQKIIIGVGAGIGALVLIAAASYHFYQRRNQSKYAPTFHTTRRFSSTFSFRTNYENDGCHGLPIFYYEELKEATDDFDQKNKVGDGGFGTIYKGKLRDGRVVAIKRLYETNYKIKERFLNEVEILAKLRHPNLVILYGCTSPCSKRLLLVYEFISNGTVADHLHGDRAKPSSLSWSTRLNIAIKTATALRYLHCSDVIHRDIKTNNILLNDNFSVKVADFGLARLFPFNVTHVLTAPQGTPGYIDPEYHQCYQLTEKSDVYSFGVVLMELISSLPAVDIKRHRHEIHLSTMAINKIQMGALHELVDKHLGFDCNDNIRRMISAVAELAFRCLQHAKEMRPCMEEVLETLKSIQNLDEPTNKAIEMGNLPDDAALLKSQLLHSPDLVMAKYDSKLTTPNASG